MNPLLFRKCASVEALCTIKDVTPDDARTIRSIWKGVTNRAEARERIDSILRTCGVEYLGRAKRNGDEVYYCNAGDTYSTTVLFIGPRMIVGCWGDLVEAGRIREPEQF